MRAAGLRGGGAGALAPLLAVLLAACGGEEPAPQPRDGGTTAPGVSEGPSAPDGDGPGPQLPDVPRLPAELRIEVDGEALTAARVEELLQSEWAAYVNLPTAPAGEQTRLRDFFADPRTRCAGLLVETAIAREARKRFPELDAEALATQEQRLRAAGRLRWFEDVHGAEAARAFVERFERRRLLEAQFAAATEEVPEEEVFAVYEREILTNLPPAAEREQLDVSFGTHGPRIRARLQHERGLAELEAWSQARAAEMELAVVLPDGTKRE